MSWYTSAAKRGWPGVVAALATLSPAVSAETKLLWGDTHLHTSYSIDAFFNNNLSVDPDYAYRFAKGIPVMHPYHRAWMRLEAPLDFLVVSDHAEFIGGLRSIYLDGLPREDVGFVDSIRNWYATGQLRGVIDTGQGPAFFRDILPPGADPREIAAGWGDGGGGLLPALSPGVFRAAWEEIVDAAEAHYQPGTFTSLIGWEWTSAPGGANLHRVVLTDAGAEQVLGFQPVSAAESPYPEDLWAWLDETSAATGVRFLSIPHNPNVSKGLMFPDITLRGEPVDADHARARMRWERIVEVTQIKGDSEAHPLLSPDDEFADFETFPFHLQGDTQEYAPEAGDYARSALRRGLARGAAVGINPFQFGMIGSTDSHSGLSTAAEDDFGGKMATDSIPERKDDVVISGFATGWTMSASGLAAVWAEENTREAIVDAMHRRETYGTSGPRIRVRFFGGWEFSETDLEAEDVAATGYGKGVPMGGELRTAPDGAAPRFLAVAYKDPSGANLDRVQIVKGWLDADGATHERVFDVAWSGDRRPGADGKLPPVGNTVDLETARYANSIGAATLSTVWEDPSFDAGQPSFYYVRVIEIPTPRHTLYDALALGRGVPDYGPSTLQERAYTSPIWYRPSTE
ncbi:MAG: DUF3604 domain-containing protein [Gammaproteobacteria bacterium]|nr:DUF3604 domain-containing protein [Gammaproteobacteria bacterium]